MCGRIVDFLTGEQIEAMFRRVGPVRIGLERPPRYNVAPTQPIATARRADNGELACSPLRWGLVPGWSKEGLTGKPLINARAEIVSSKPAFRRAFAQRRCLVAVTGFYEWQARAAGPKQPYFISIGDGGPMTFAALWERWSGYDDAALETVAIITVEASDEMAAVHNRMPAILSSAEEQTAWLDPALRLDAAQDLLRPLPPGLLRFRTVSARVNNTRNGDPALLDEQIVDTPQAPLKMRRRNEPDPNEAQDLQGDLF